jgi:hypothetical protein
MSDLFLTDADRKKFRECVEEAKKGGVGDSDAHEMGMVVFLKYKCLTDLFFLGYEMLGLRGVKVHKKVLIHPPLHRQLARAIEQPGSKMIIIPRYCLKTEWVIIWIVQRILQEPETVRIAYISRTAGLGRSVLKRVVQYLMNPSLMELFEGTIPKVGKLTQGMPTNWDRITEDFLTVHRDRTDGIAPKEHQLEVFGIEATITGKHFTDQIYDDPINEETVRSPSQMQKSEEFVQHAVNLLEPGGNETYIGTPYHYADLIAHCIQEKYFDRIYRRSMVENGKSIYPTFFPLAEIEKRKKRMGNYIFSCNPGYAPIWMTDFTFKRLDQVVVGDEVVGFGHGDSDNRCTLQKSTVLAKQTRVAEVVRVELSDGTCVICTPDHEWYTGRQDKSHKLYTPAHIGGTLLRAVDLVDHEEQPLDKWGYLAGIIDGEGSCKHGGIIAIHQSERVNPMVVDRIRSTLHDLGIECDERHDDKPDCVSFILQGGRQIRVDILNYGHPAKSGQIINGMWEHAKRPIKNRPRVKSIRPWGRVPVYSMETTTGNYVVWGCMSKNCQLMCDPLPKEDLLFPPPQPTYTELPGEKMDYYITVDPAATTQTYSDFTAFAVVAIDGMGRVWVEDSFQIKKEGQEIARILIQLNEKYKPRRIGIEAGLQTHLIGIIQLLKKNWEVAQGAPIALPIEPIVVSTKDKYDRFNISIGSWIRTGRMKIKETLHPLMSQMEKVNRNYVGHDDLVDAVALVFQLVPAFGGGMKRVDGQARVFDTFEQMMKRGKDPVRWGDRFAV